MGAIPEMVLDVPISRSIIFPVKVLFNGLFAAYELFVGKLEVLLEFVKKPTSASPTFPFRILAYLVDGADETYGYHLIFVPTSSHDRYMLQDHTRAVRARWR